MKIILILSLISMVTFGQEKFIKVNQKAPEIISKDIYGREVNLKELIRTKKILLTFQRYAICPVCNYRIRELMKMYHQLEIEGIEVVMFIESPASNILKNLKKQKIPFYIIADPENVFYKAYGVEKSTIKSISSFITNSETKRKIKEGEKYLNPEANIDGTLRRIEAEFMVNMLGVITIVHYGEYIGDFLSLEKVKNFTIRN